jgi:UDP-glucose 4-epimerase
VSLLITGGAGFIGSHIVELLAPMYRVVVWDDFSTGKRESLPNGVEILEGDVRDEEGLTRACYEHKIETIIHLAAQSNVRESLANPYRDASVNVLGGVAILRACVTARVRRFIFASSGGAVYGERRRQPCPENAATSPLSPYGAAKLAVEVYLRTLGGPAGLRSVTLRLGNVYGPRQSPQGEAGVVSLFANAMLSGASPIIFGDGRQTRDFVYVRDVARAFKAALRAPAGIYNIGTGVESSVLEIAKLLSHEIGFTGAIVHRPSIRGEVRRNALDVSRAREGMRWRASTPLREGLRATVRWLARTDKPVLTLEETGASGR